MEKVVILMEVPLFSPPNPYSFHRTYLHLPESPSIYIHLFLALYFILFHSRTLIDLRGYSQDWFLARSNPGTIHCNK